MLTPIAPSPGLWVPADHTGAVFLGFHCLCCLCDALRTHPLCGLLAQPPAAAVQCAYLLSALVPVHTPRTV